MEGNLGAKAISKRMKAKGLQKLKFYCELCEKQCRDENGFKCHTTSEGHERQMQLFGENPDKIIQDFSQKFEDAFLGHLKFRRGVSATAVYSEYISDRHHVHMNATRWLSLTEFVKYLGRTGKCKVENTEKGWFIACNNGGDNNNGRDKRLRSKFRDELKHEQEIIARQIQRASSSFVQIEDQDPKDGELPNKKVKVAFALSRNNKAKGGAAAAAAYIYGSF